MKKKNLLLGGYLSQEICQGGDMLKFLLVFSNNINLGWLPREERG